MKKVVFILLIICSSCTPRGCQRAQRQMQFSERNYHIKQYSGGKCIGEYKFKGILNTEEQSDGYYFIQSDTLIEVSGDITIKSW